MINEELINTSEVYEGIILSGELAEDIECRYPVYIPKLMANRELGMIPIWAKNEINSNKYTRWEDPETQEIQSVGGYTPLNEGMRVHIKFRNSSLSSAYIIGIKSFYSKYISRDNIYLINKTKKGSYIIQDDDREITHIMHNNGKTNITLDNEKVMLSVHSNNGIGDDFVLNGLEVDVTGTKLTFGTNSIILDETGISFQVGDTSLRLSESDIQLVTQGNIDIISDKRTQIKGNKLNLTGSENLNIYSMDTKISGGQILNLTGNVVGIDSAISTHLKSSQYTIIESLIYTGINTQMFDLTTTLNLSINSLATTTISGTNLNLSGTALINIGSSAINMDGMVMHNLGIAASTCSAMATSNLAISTGCVAAGIATSTGLGLNTFVNGIVGSTMTSTLAGCSTPVGEIVKKVRSSYTAAEDSIQKTTYLKENDNSLKDYVTNQFTHLRNYHDIV